jgi:hypothetical protein
MKLLLVLVLTMFSSIVAADPLNDANNNLTKANAALTRCWNNYRNCSSEETALTQANQVYRNELFKAQNQAQKQDEARRRRARGEMTMEDINEYERQHPQK